MKAHRSSGQQPQTRRCGVNSVPGLWIGQRVGLPVEAAELGPAADRAVRPRTPAELAFLALGPVAEAFLRRAAAAGATRMPTDLSAIVDLERAHGRPSLVAALERALDHRSFRAADVRAILGAGLLHPPQRCPLSAGGRAASVMGSPLRVACVSSGFTQLSPPA